MSVRYAPRALDDITGILNYLERQSPQCARNVARAMHKTIELIEQFPQSGRLVELGVRVLPVGAYPYLIYWSTEADDVWLIHIRHTARRPWDPARQRG